MPRAKRPRQSLHEPPISRHQQIDDADADSALVDDRMEDDTAGQEDAELTEADDVPLETRPVEAASTFTHQPGQYPPVQHQAKKVDKKRNRREALMQKLTASAKPVSPYSKSTLRRMKRKEKQSMGLEAVGKALTDAMPRMEDVEEEEPSTKVKRNESNEVQPGRTKVSAASSAKQPQPTATSKNLSSKARQKMLKQERQRLPAILAHSAFAASPFETIRLHARNTMAAEAAEKQR